MRLSRTPPCSAPSRSPDSRAKRRTATRGQRRDVGLRSLRADTMRHGSPARLNPVWKTPPTTEHELVERLMHVEESSRLLGWSTRALRGSTRATPMTSTAVLRTYPHRPSLRPTIARPEATLTSTAAITPSTTINFTGTTRMRTMPPDSTLCTYPIARIPDPLSSAARGLALVEPRCTPGKPLPLLPSQVSKAFPKCTCASQDALPLRRAG